MLIKIILHLEKQYTLSSKLSIIWRIIALFFVYFHYITVALITIFNFFFKSILSVRRFHNWRNYLMW